jgi:putative lipoic acid-binding regulatory protein
MNDRTRIILAFLLLLGAARAFSAQPFSARAEVSDSEAFMGGSIQLVIQVQGTTKPDPIDVSGIRDFAVRYVGTNPATQRQVTFNQGHRVETVRESASIVYELTPKREGSLIVPSLVVGYDGKKVRTQVIRVQARKPKETDKVRLNVRLSRQTCYVGEAVRATWTLYFSANLSGLNIAAPVLQDPRFTIPDYDMKVDPARRRQYRQLRFADFQAIALQSESVLDGKRYATLTFEKVLIPRVAGEFTLPPSNAYASIVVGRRRTNDFFQRVVDVTESVAVPSNSPKLTVKELPAKGRPANFSGQVGNFRLSAVADPTAVNVGDPINLTLVIEGPEFLDQVECPDLTAQADLTANFRISQNSEPGTIQGTRKIFKRIIRATHPDVKEIPPIELPYFDTAKGSYEVARSRPIPLQVRATKVVTARDAEGQDAPTPVTRAVKKRGRGLAANYEDSSVLRDQRAGLQTLTSPLWLATLAGTPLAYILLALGVGIHRRRHADPAARQARRARATCLKSLAKARSQDDAHGVTLAALRTYFGAKFALTAGALTYQDLAPKLAEANVSPELGDELRALFEHCEAGRYAGAASIDAEQLVANATDLVRRIDKSMGR